MENYENLSITINELTKDYGKEKGIHGISTVFEPGKLNIVTGANGSGKSTLFKCIMGLVNYQGRIIKRKLRIGYAPEEYIMPLGMSVEDFLWSIGKIKGLSSEVLDENLEIYLDFFGLKQYRKRPIAQLSHGMRQKVNLVQAFVHEPRIILLDEPLTGLDIDTIPRLISLLKEKAKTRLVVITTHNLQLFRFKEKTLYKIVEGRLDVG